jgi:lactate dehydrogenase-like 2-hydroxyacid dehydrogenase
MKSEILLLRAFYEPTVAALERDYVVHKLWRASDPAAFIREVAPNVRVVVTNTTRGLSADEIAQFPRLELIACFGPYVELIDLPAAKARGIAVTCTPDSTAEPVADLAMGLIVAVMRRIAEADRFIRAGKWPEGVFASGREVHGKRLGIVGLGRIGRELAKRASGFDMRVCYHGPRPKDGVSYAYFADLVQMAMEVDCLAVTCPLTAATRNLIDARVLAALGPQGYLVNVARGAVVDEPALVAALANGELAGAALDVFRDEPRVPEVLMRMDNVVLAPHMGTSTREVRDERSRKLLADLAAFFARRPLVHEVSAGA